MSYKTHAQTNGEPVAAVDMLLCKVCGALTDQVTLRDHGARCYRCYAACCRSTPQTDPRMASVIADAGDGPLAWARRIQLRAERKVDPPSRAALEMARDLLTKNDRYRPPVDDWSDEP